VKVLWASSGGLPLFGGAQITGHAFLAGLRVQRGWDVVLATKNHRKSRAHLRSVPIETYRDVDELKSLVRRERPQVVIAALDAVPDALRVAARFGLPSIVYLHSFEYCPPTAEEIGAWGVSARKTYADDDVARWAVTAPSRLVVNSHFLGARMRERHHVAASVVYPEVERPELLAPRGPYISGICGYRYKGAEVFLALADAFPRERFLLVGDVDPALASAFAARRNVRRLGRAAVGRFLTMSGSSSCHRGGPSPSGASRSKRWPPASRRSSAVPADWRRSSGRRRSASTRSATPRRGSKRSSPSSGRRICARSWGTLGRRLAEPFVRDDSTRVLAEMIGDLARDAVPELDDRMLALCGGTTRATAYSMINARWASALAARSGLRVADVQTAAELDRAAADVVVHHNYGDNFAEAVVPDAGLLVAVRTWDFGPYPPAWVKRINEEVDLLVVYSTHVRRNAIASGIPARKVRVVPLGVDATMFARTGPEYPCRRRRRSAFCSSAHP
jgi:glycosyltransferase involved in cell wall biosynthesis